MITNQLTTRLFDNFNLQSRIFRRAACTFIAIFIAVIIYRYFSLTQGFRVPLTTIIVMQSSTAATLRKGLQRFLGTIIGIILGSLLALHIHNSYLLDFFLVFFIFVAYYAKAFNIINYGIFVVPLTIMIVFLVSALVPQESHRLILARLYDTSLGAAIGVVITFFILPNSLEDDVNNGITNIITTQFQYLSSILKLLLNPVDNIALANSKQKSFEQCLTHNRLLFNDWIYELWLKIEPKQHQHELIIILFEKLGQLLFALHHLTRDGMSQSLYLELNPIIRNFIKDITHVSKQGFTKDTEFQQRFNEHILSLKELKKGITQSDDLLFMTSLILNLEEYYSCVKELNQYLTMTKKLNCLTLCAVF